MFGEILRRSEIISTGEIIPAEINWPPLAEDEEEAEVNLFPDDDVNFKETDSKWSSVAVVEKGKAKLNGAQTFSPVGLKILVVDDNRVCLAVLARMLNRCKYSVTTCNSAATALSLVHDKSTPFDLVLCDVHMPGMDGFKLLEALEAVRELPVIMMSSDDETGVVMKGISKGACDYFLKPVNLQRLRTIWQHVVRRREMVESGKDGDSDRDNFRKRKGKEEIVDDPVEFVNSSKKKARLVWTPPLHKQFVDAVTVLGTSNAVPKQILEKMNVKGISRENVASHLQKYRKFLTGKDEAKDSGVAGVNLHYQTAPEAYQTGGHLVGGSLEIQSGAISTLPFNLSSLHSSNGMPPLHSPNTLSSFHSPSTLPSLHSPNTLSSLHSPNTLSSLHSPNTLSSLHSPNTMSSLHSPNRLSSLHSPNAMSSHHSPNTLPSFLNPTNMASHLFSNQMSSLHSLNTKPSLHSADTMNALSFPNLPRHNSPSLPKPTRINLPSHQTLPFFPSSSTVTSIHSHQTMFPLSPGHISSSLHSAKPASPGYSPNTELYPVPSQSFQVVEAGNVRSGIPPPDPFLPPFDVAANNNFPNRIRPSMVYSPTLVAPAFYSTEYQF